MRRSRRPPARSTRADGRTLCHEHLLTASETVRVQYPHLHDEEQELARALEQVRGSDGPRRADDRRPGLHGPRPRRAASPRASPRRPAYSSSWRPASTASTTRTSPTTSRRATRTTSPTRFVHDIEVGIQGTAVKAAFLKTAADEPGSRPTSRRSTALRRGRASGPARRSWPTRGRRAGPASIRCGSSSRRASRRRRS